MPSEPYSVTNRPPECSKYKPEIYENFGSELDQEFHADEEGYKQGYHLPKALWQPESFKGFDPNKSTVAISIVEDDSLDGINKLLVALDEYFKLPEAKEALGDRNLFILWATSHHDMEKVLKEFAKKVQDRSKTFFLNLLDWKINTGSGPDWTKEGTISSSMGKMFHDIDVSIYNDDEVVQRKNRTIFQSSYPPGVGVGTYCAEENFIDTNSWSSKIQATIEYLKDSWNENGHLAFKKLGQAISLVDNNYTGIKVPFEAFMKYVDGLENK